MVPTIEPKLKPENLPEWDGKHSTAIDYFWDVGQFANLGGWMPEALGFWLPSRLVKGSDVQSWFTTLALTRQAEMRSHYLVYLQVIKDRYLGRTWQLLMNMEFEQQTFRQAGFEKETPRGFINRRVRYTRMLANSDDGGPLEVFIIMRRAPIRWSTILVLENIHSTEDLQDKVNVHEETLVDAVKDSSNSLSGLIANLRKLGVTIDTNRGFNPKQRRVNTVHGVEEETNSSNEAGNPLDSEKTSLEGDESTMKEVYATFQRRQRPPPPGGYPFAKNDHVMTKMRRPPPSPCKVCGSKNHWDRECPDWNVYLEKQNRGALLVNASPEEEETGLLYHSAYIVMLNERVSQSF